MPQADITIVNAGDPLIWDDLDHDSATYLPDAVWRVAILERGMQGGKASVALRLDLPGGGSVVAETSLDILISIVAAARGAFPAQFVGGPFAVGWSDITGDDQQQGD